MTERPPSSDLRSQDRENVVLSSRTSRGPPAPRVIRGRSLCRASRRARSARRRSLADSDHLVAAYDAGVEPKARSQWAYARIRFFRHKLAVGSLVLLFDQLRRSVRQAGRAVRLRRDPVHRSLKLIENPNLVAESINQAPTTRDWHLFGTDNVGRDYLSRVIFGLRTSLWVAVFVALLSTVFGTTSARSSGYYGGTTDNLLMRFTDLILTLPGLAVLLTAAAFLGNGDPIKVGLILAFLFWTLLARIVRGTFLSLREKEYVEAAKASGASDARIIVRHMLPNTLGPIIVNMTLVIATAILVEAALSFLGFGIQPPQAGTRQPDRPGAGGGLPDVVARHLPGPRDRADRALHQLRRRRAARCARPDAAEGSWLSRSCRSRS